MPIENDRWLHHLPPGWHLLFRRLVDDLAELDPDLTIGQAKQKFGKLRVYLNHGTTDAHALVDASTEASRSACEECGAAARLCKDRHGWYRTLCESHREGFELTGTRVSSGR